MSARRRPGSARSVAAGLGVAAVAGVVYWWSARSFDAGRPDFFHLADAFLHGRTWLDFAPGPWDVVVDGGRVYVPFAPFPAIAFMPLVAVLGVPTLVAGEPIVNAVLAAAGVLLVWSLAGRLGVTRLRDRFWLVLLFGFSTQLWWVTTRGGVWHTGHLVATLLTLLAIGESFGRRRPLVLGLLAGAAFLTRGPLALAAPFYAWVIVDGAGRGLHREALRPLVRYAIGILPAVAFFLWYNDVRFGSPLESGYGQASLPEWLERQRDLGLFAPVHLAMNLDYLLLHLPRVIPEFPWLKPDGLGLSILLTSPGLLLAVRAPWRRRVPIALGLTALLVLVPSLLYYGGGWLQYGFRYALDSLPFVIALCCLAAARRGIGWGWGALIAAGVVVGAGGVYWAYHL